MHLSMRAISTNISNIGIMLIQELIRVDYDFQASSTVAMAVECNVRFILIFCKGSTSSNEMIYRFPF